MKATGLLESELKKRMDLIMDEDFRKNCSEVAKKIGVTAKEWEENKAFILMMWANEVAYMDGKNGL